MVSEVETREPSPMACHQRNIFSLAFHLTGGNKNAAYEITVSSFVEAGVSEAGQGDTFFAKLTALTVERCRNVKGAPRSDRSDCLDLPVKRKKLLQMTKAALYCLSFESKTYLLLRDQQHLSYALIAGILKVSEQEARIRTAEARVDLREKIGEILKHAR